MLRLTPPDHIRLGAANTLNMYYGGSEANTAISLSVLGNDVCYVTKLPANPLGDAALGTLARYQVDTGYIVRGGERLGTYYLETGASLRPSFVVYDRKNSAIATADPDEFDYEGALKGADLLHVTGITAVLSDNAYQITKNLVDTAWENQIPVSIDLNYRAKLWTDGVAEKQKRMQYLVEHAAICFGNPLDLMKSCGYDDGHDYLSMPYREVVSADAMGAAVKAYGFRYLLTSLRQNLSASKNILSAAVSDGFGLYTGASYEIDQIIDRVGSGDAMVAGFLHSLFAGRSMEESLEFAIAAAAIKHTIPGDFNTASEDEILALMATGGRGLVSR